MIERSRRLRSATPDRAFRPVGTWALLPPERVRTVLTLCVFFIIIIDAARSMGGGFSAVPEYVTYGTFSPLEKKSDK